MNTAPLRPQSAMTPSRPVVLFFTLAGTILVVLPDTLSAHLSRVDELLLRMVIRVAFLLALALIYWGRVGCRGGPLAATYFIASTALLIDWYFSNWLVGLLAIPLQSPAGYAVDKVEGALLITIIVVLLTRGFGGNLASLYMKRGKLKRWLTIGTVSFAFFLLTAPLAAKNLFYAGTLTWATVANWAPWILLFVLANALGEELIFRGLLLPRIALMIGDTSAVLVVTAAFTLWHIGGATYTATLPLYLEIVFPLGLAWAYVVRSTEACGALYSSTPARTSPS